MAEISAELDQLLALGKEFNELKSSFSDKALPLIKRLDIPSSAVPVMAVGFHGSYTQLQTSTEEAATAVGKMISELSSAIQTVSKKWKEIEEQKGKNVTSIYP